MRHGMQFQKFIPQVIDPVPDIVYLIGGTSIKGNLCTFRVCGGALIARKAPPLLGALFLGRLVGQVQAREPSHLAVSEACRENGRFHDHNAVWAILGTWKTFGFFASISLAYIEFPLLK
jgi:hypothetical protein